MTEQTDQDLALYPMVEQADATGAVAAVHADLLTRMPFVPSLFKSLALCPQYLVLANEQAADDEALSRGARDLIAFARGVAQPPGEEPVRSSLGRYAMPIGRMLLLAAGLQLALRGELSAASAPGQEPPRRTPDAAPAPTVDSAPAPGLYGQIREALGTPIVNTVWRGLAQEGRLEAAWAVLRPQIPQARQAALPLTDRATEMAREVAWPVVADRAALRRLGAADAAAGMVAVLDAYVVTLARALALVASSAPESDL